MWPEPSEVIGKGSLQSCVPSEMSVRDTSRKSDVVREAGPTQLCVLPESPSGEPCSPHTSCLGKPAGSYQEFQGAWVSAASPSMLTAWGSVTWVRGVGCAPGTEESRTGAFLGTRTWRLCQSGPRAHHLLSGQCPVVCRLYLAPLFPSSALCALL